MKKDTMLMSFKGPCVCVCVYVGTQEAYRELV